ncbi:MAG: hotdog fold thioesterase [Verrucomicrobia bacterium]|nr:hotdog fold thioesterase [Verrucomicrobiota bacterium]
MDSAQLQAFFRRDRYAAHSGIELVEVTPGYAKARLPLSAVHLNGLDIAHGGAIFTLADFAFAVASNSHGTIAVAINTNLTIMKATRAGTLWAEAREVSKNPRLGNYTVEVRDDAGDLVALFQGLAYRKSEPLPVPPAA